MISYKEKDNLEKQMEIIMMVIGKMIKLKAMVLSLELMEISFKEIGYKIKFKDKEHLNLQ